MWEGLTEAERVAAWPSFSEGAVGQGVMTPEEAAFFFDRFRALFPIHRSGLQAIAAAFREWQASRKLQNGV